ncbi:MAG TPA: M23 family metallopeptidase, partial [Flavobacteriales bacterium]|nr:M23 family metallopeptidase [Flavobacteriales bacterium]
SLGFGVRAQVDTAGYGGPDALETYDELLEEDATAAVPGMNIATTAASEWDVNDSLLFIPGYDMYCHWNTDAIFDRNNTPRFVHDTLRLVLSQGDCDHHMPCGGKLNSAFGPRHGRMHYGVDLELETGDPVVSAFAGMVRISKYNKSFGHVVVVRHTNGLETLYAHLSKRWVEPGQMIEAGDTLGLGGNTGHSHGSHLHFEVRFLDQPIDPTLVFDIANGDLKARTFDIHKGTFASIAAAKAAASARRYHIVHSGETLSGIARRYHTSVPAICRLNGIRQSGTLRVGQRVRYN